MFPFAIDQIHLLNKLKTNKKDVRYEEIHKKLLRFVYYWKHCALNQKLYYAYSDSRFTASWNSVRSLFDKYPQAPVPQELQYISGTPASIDHLSEAAIKLLPPFVCQGVHPFWDELSGEAKLHDAFLFYLLESWEAVNIEDILSRKMSLKQIMENHIVRCNQLQAFIGTQILWCQTYFQAENIFHVLDDIQKKLLHANAYEAAFTLHSALAAGPVNRLCKPFMEQKKCATLFIATDAPFALKDNSKILREMQEENEHVFEVSAIFKKDFTAIEENIPDYRDGSLNIEKFEQLGWIYHRIALAKNHLRNFWNEKELKINDLIFLALKSQPTDADEFTKDIHWTRSEEIHPSGSQKYWDIEISS